MGAEDSLMAAAVRRMTADRVTTAEHDVRRILDAGLALIQEAPDTSPKVADIVRRAGISNDAFYRAFRSKDELTAAVIDDGARRLIAYARHQIEKATDAPGQLRRCVDAVFQQAIDPTVAVTTRAVLRSSTASGQAHGIASNHIRQQLADELVPTFIELGSLTPDRDALVAVGAIVSTMEQFLWNEEVPQEADADHLTRWILARYRRTGTPDPTS